MKKVEAFFDDATSTLTYLVYDELTKDAVIIDPVLDFDYPSATTSTKSIEVLMAFTKIHHLKVHYILETHAHADHLTAAHELLTHYLPSAQVAIGKHITEVQREFKNIFNLPASFKTDGSQFSRLFNDYEVVTAGSLTFKVLFTPGHTPACVSYLFEDSVFTGDTLFMPDYGTGRCDFPGGSSSALFHSVSQRLYKLPDETRVFVGHDYQPGGRPLAFETSIGLSKEKNIQLRANTSEFDFLDFRKKRDAKLSAPRLLFPSIQVNIAAGKFPEPEANGRCYLKIPLSQGRA